MKLYYNDKFINLQICNTFFKRLKGIMFKKEKLTYALLFKNCNSIHTFFCKQNIDVIFLDKNNNILFFKTNIKPNKIVYYKKGKTTIETPNNYFKNLKIGTSFTIK